MGKSLTLKTLLEFMDSLEEEGEWLWTDTLMKSYFSDRKDALYKKLQRFVDAGLIVRVARGVYANPRSRNRHFFTPQLRTLNYTHAQDTPGNRYG